MSFLLKIGSGGQKGERMYAHYHGKSHDFFFLKPFNLAASYNPGLNFLPPGHLNHGHSSLQKEPMQFNKFQFLICILFQPIPVNLVLILVFHRGLNEKWQW